MQEGLRNTQTHDQHKGSDCENVFLLRRAGQATGAHGIHADFSSGMKTPPTNDGSSSPSPSVVPVFNSDGRYYTPSFILPEDRVKFERNAEVCLVSHLRKVKDMSQQKNQMFVPKPSEANRFCMVCKSPFDDYLTHITSPSHLSLLRESEFYGDILELCRRQTPLTGAAPQKRIKKERGTKEKKKSARRSGAGRRKSHESASTGLESQEGQLLIEAQ